MRYYGNFIARPCQWRKSLDGLRRIQAGEPPAQPTYIRNSGGLAGTAAEAVDDGYKTAGGGGAGELTRRSRRGKHKQNSSVSRQDRRRRGHGDGE